MVKIAQKGNKNLVFHLSVLKISGFKQATSWHSTVQDCQTGDDLNTHFI